MSELPRMNVEATVLFRRGTEIAIPPIELPRETRRDGETIERTALRLVQAHGVNGSIDRHIPLPRLDAAEEMPRAYFVEAEYGELDLSELFVGHDDILWHLDKRSGLSDVDRHIVLSAWRLLAR